MTPQKSKLTLVMRVIASALRKGKHPIQLVSLIFENFMQIMLTDDRLRLMATFHDIEKITRIIFSWLFSNDDASLYPKYIQLQRYSQEMLSLSRYAITIPITYKNPNTVFDKTVEARVSRWEAPGLSCLSSNALILLYCYFTSFQFFRFSQTDCWSQ